MIGAQIRVGERERFVDVRRIGEARVLERRDAIQFDLVTDERRLGDERARLGSSTTMATAATATRSTSGRGH